MILADLLGGGPCKQSPECAPGWAALPLPPQGQWTLAGRGRTRDGDSGRPWEDPGRGHWRAVGGPGNGAVHTMVQVWSWAQGGDSKATGVGQA